MKFELFVKGVPRVTLLVPNNAGCDWLLFERLELLTLDQLAKFAVQYDLTMLVSSIPDSKGAFDEDEN